MIFSSANYANFQGRIVGMVQSLWLHDVKMMKSKSSERQDHAAASAGAEMQPGPENNHPAHLLLVTADLSATAGLCLEVIVDEGCPGSLHPPG